MIFEPSPMKEIHQIREKFYEEGKNLSRKDDLKRIRKAAEQVIKKYRLTFKTSLPIA